MNKKDFVSEIAKITGYSKNESARALDGLLKTFTKVLKEGQDIRLIGFGSFVVKTRKATEGRNPRTGKKIIIPEVKLPKFKAGKALKDAVSS